ncbi:hypothetical protein CTEN210_17206 [Chaetoceros tenuissimus]|uniref:JmjC domain-containing protein n=1 Tax=Chaetoceros tenuissimus TaxID=426638 RepID=A0AAD3DD13_9STRA|nr:hypothetical protein CTEN210_17206 [Chaetoceros tenuissimus]
MKDRFVRKDDAFRGRHLCATEHIAKDEVIFVERPLLSLQSVANSHQGALCCRSCRAFVGGPDLCMLLASGKLNRDGVWSYYNENESEILGLGSANENLNYKMVPCRNNCGELFCSKKCENECHLAGHDLLCTGLIPEGKNETECEELHPLLQFKVHAVQSNEIFLLVADLVAAVVSIRRRQIARDLMLRERNDDSTGNDKDALEKLLAPYLDFTLVPWWEVATAHMINDPMKMTECVHLNKTLRELCDTSSKLLKEAFVCIDGDDEFKDTLKMAMDECQEKYAIFSENFFGKIIGSFEQNSLGIRARSPLCRDILENADLRKRRHEELVTIIDLAGMIGDDDENDEDEAEENDHNVPADTVEKDSSLDTTEIDSRGENGYDYSVEDIASFLATLKIDEQGLGFKDKGSDAVNNEGVDEAEGEGDDDDHDDVDNVMGDDLDAMFVPLDGTCMYSITCKQNHSCDANVVPRYSYSCAGGGMMARWGKDYPLVIQCVAKRDIAPGEELCISYIDADASYENRQALLLNYGFKCICSKCFRECNGNEDDQNVVKRDVSASNEDIFGEDDPFGEDDDTDESSGTGDDESVEENGDSMIMERLQNLNSSLSQLTIGAIPMVIAAPSIAFINQLGAQLSQNIANTTHENAEIVIMLKKTIDCMMCKDFCGLKAVSDVAEKACISLLHEHKMWPDALMREAHGCFCVMSALSHGQHGNYIHAIQYLDKASIFGLPRDRVESLFQYLEYHARRITCSHTSSYSQMAIIPDYSDENLRKLIFSKGLSKPIVNPVEEVDFEDFVENKQIFGQQPFVVRNYAAKFPAISKWRHLSYFANNFGPRIVPIEHGLMSTKQGMKEELLTIDDFIQFHMAPSTEHTIFALDDATGKVAYLAQHQLLDQIPELRNDVITPSQCGEGGPIQTNAWIGTGGTRTPLHFDTYSNLFIQLVGSKYVRLYNQSEREKLYVLKGKDGSNYALQGNMSAVDCEKENFNLHPEAENAEFVEVVLLPGDLLFIPEKVWHYVRGITTSASVNFWW